MSMNVKAALPVILAAVAVVCVGGCKKASPTTPEIVIATSTIPPQVLPLSIAVVAPYIGQTISNVLEQSLFQGLTATGANRWQVNCPAGGTAKLELSPTYRVQSGNVVMLEDTEFTLSECQVETKGATFIGSPTLLGRLMDLVVRPLSAQSRQRLNIRGRVRTRGKWRQPIMTSRGPEYRTDEGARVTGSIDVNQVNCGGNTCPPMNAIGMDCNLDGKVCNGSIGGVGVTQGPRDTPPPQNPTTTTTTIPPSGSGFSVSPSRLNLGAANWCTGNTQTGTVTVTTGSAVNWSVRLQFTTELPGFVFSLNRTSGTGSGTVTITMRAIRDPSVPCVGIRIPGGIGNGFFFTFSGGQQIAVPVVADLVTLQ
jgi:hypothetical protein